MIYVHKMENDALKAIILETDTTATLFLDEEPALHMEKDYSTEPTSYNFYQIRNDDEHIDPKPIREVIDFITDTFAAGYIMTDEEFNDLPHIGSIDINGFLLIE